jgi:hypothetical protein
VTSRPVGAPRERRGDDHKIGSYLPGAYQTMIRTLNAFILPLIYVGAQLLWYTLFRALEPVVTTDTAIRTQRKRRAWVLTIPISFFFGFVAGPYFGYRLIAAMLEGAPVVASFLNQTSIFAIHSVTFMMSFLALDIIVGVLEYREFLGMDTAWIHHTAYFLLYGYLFLTRRTHYVLIGACCEIPTFILALGVLVPRLRQDLAFGVTFFFTRIVWFLVLAIVYMIPSYNTRLLFVEWIIPTVSSTSLHIWWFSKWYGGLGKASKLAKKEVEGEKVEGKKVE